MYIRFSGGLGNQMFQYAFFEALKQKFPDKKILCDIGDYSRCSHHYGYELERIFHLHLPYCSEKEAASHLIKMSLPYRIFRKIGIKKAGYPKAFVDKEEGYFPDIWAQVANENLLWGYWQDERYFMDVKEKVRSSLTFPPFTDERNLHIQSQMQRTESVSLHVRRGDYLTAAGYVNLSNTDYYQKAVELVKNKISLPKWFVFSDDTDWCRENLHLPDDTTVFVDWNTGKDSYKDMQLMTNCKHHIIANSTFSWWGAWLKSTDGIVIAPATWQVGKERFNRSIVCDGWQTIV